MKIGLLGLTFGYKHQCNNRGCEALSVSFLEVLNEIAKRVDKVFCVFLFVPFSIRKVGELVKGKEYVKDLYLIDRKYSNLELDIIRYWVHKGRPQLLNSAKKCNIIFDFTSGDSFTDIYGRERYYDLTMAKKQVLNMGIPLVLGSQTIGPFNDDSIRKDAASVIKRCKEVIVRDQISCDYVQEISGESAKKTTDVAFFLPYEKKEHHQDNKTIIGFNPSGLLWHGGYDRNNQFGLTFNYRDYCVGVLEKIMKIEGSEVLLIPHAYSNNMQSVDNDLIPVMELKKLFPKCEAITEQLNSMELKSRINQCDIFIGARMHATIAAFSSGVPTIPVAYSRKFVGLYNEYDYFHIIDATKMSLNDAVENTVKDIQNISIISSDIERAKTKINERKGNIIETYSQLLE